MQLEGAIPPPAFADAPHAYPEIFAVRGEALSGTEQILAAGPVGTTFDIRLRWPDGTEPDHELRRPEEPNIPPPSTHFGDRWLVSGRVGSIGYLRVKTFDPQRGTLGPDGKMTTMLRAALAELGDTEGLILDLQGNGGGAGASGPRASCGMRGEPSGSSQHATASVALGEIIRGRFVFAARPRPGQGPFGSGLLMIPRRSRIFGYHFRAVPGDFALPPPRPSSPDLSSRTAPESRSSTGSTPNGRPTHSRAPSTQGYPCTDSPWLSGPHCC